MIFLKVLFSYVRTYWKYIASILLFVVGYYFLNYRNNSSLKDILDRINKGHEEELGDIKNSYERQLKEKEENIRKLEETISIVEKKYKEAQKELDESKKREIKKIVEETKGNPSELARKLQESTGFKIF